MNHPNPARREYTKEERLARACLRAARHIRELWEEKGCSDTRLIDGLFIPDELVHAGASLKYDGKGRREHVVPRRVIVVECHAMLERGKSDQEIADLIRNNVKVVKISLDEQKRLDGRGETNLKQKMPSGWSFGDDIYARLKIAKIEWSPVDSTQHSENNS